MAASGHRAMAAVVCVVVCVWWWWCVVLMVLCGVVALWFCFFFCGLVLHLLGSVGLARLEDVDLPAMTGSKNHLRNRLKYGPLE